MWWQPFIDAYKATWRSAKFAYNFAAFAALIFVGSSIFSGHSTGYYEFTLPLGSAIGSVDSASVLPVAVAQNMPPVPAHKPKVH